MVPRLPPHTLVQPTGPTASPTNQFTAQLMPAFYYTAVHSGIALTVKSHTSHSAAGFARFGYP